jgi:MFS family permease
VLVVAGAAIAIIAFLLSVLFVRDTGAHMALEQSRDHARAADAPPTLRHAFAQASYREPALRSCSQAGLVNNLNDALAWGLVPLYLAGRGASVGEIGLVAAIYPGVWSVAQIATGHWSDRIGRKPLIVAGMLVQAGALGLLALSDGTLAPTAAAAVLLGVGTALVYPTLIAAMSDAVTPIARAPIVGVYRFWRDSGYVFGGLIAGIVADALGYGGAITLVAALTAASGLWALYDMPAHPPLPGPTPAYDTQPWPDASMTLD